MTPEEQVVVTKMLEAGYEPTMLASVLEVPFHEVLALVPYERQRMVGLDAQIAEQHRVLAHRVIEEAIRMLDEGSYQNRMKLVMKFGGDISRTLKHEKVDEHAEMREKFNELMAEMRGHD